MSLNEVLPTVQELPRADKLRLMQWLAAQLAEEEGIPLLSPYDAHEAAATLAAFLESEKAARNGDPRKQCGGVETAPMGDRYGHGG